MRPGDLQRLKDDLVEFRAELEEPGVRAALIETALPRLLATLEMIPDAYRDKDFLELGSSPYFLSLCLRRLCGGALRHGNYFGPEAKHGADRLVNQRTGEVVEFAYEAFNIETDRFPYDDESFDVVLFSELIEHLGVNPVCALAEIHRVLRPGGIVVVTTPNKLSMERFSTFAHGGAQMVDRYSPLFGYGARHNREYSPGELRELLEGCGFEIEAVTLRDLVPHGAGERLQRALWRLLLSYYAKVPRQEHIFLRARRGARFRWHFPPGLFDNIQFYTLVKYPWMEMGLNDSIQCAAGWYPLERGGAGEERRWIQGEEGQGFLKTPPGVATFVAEVFASAAPAAGPLRVRCVVWDRWLGRVRTENVYVDAESSVERGRWVKIQLPLGQRRPNPGDEVEVKIQPDLEAGRSPALAALPERERGLAVRRFWFESSEG
jgi:SAM-dependent methyltransferase